MSKEQVGTRLPADQYDRLEEYREERGISKSEAVRRLIVAGLDQQSLAADLEDAREEMHEEREERIRLETKVEQLEQRIDDLEEELEEAEQEAQSWQAKYNEAVGQIKVHSKEKGAVDRLSDWLFGG